MFGQRRTRRYPAKPQAVKAAFRELAALTGRPTPDFLKATPAPLPPLKKAPR